MADNSVSDLGHGFKEAFYGEKTLTWHSEFTYILIFIAVVLIVYFGWFNSLFIRYRQSVRARRKEEKKRAYLMRIFVLGRVEGEAETELLKRLIKYYSLSADSSGNPASPEQLLGFTKSLVRLTRRLEYDGRGRLAIPALDKQLGETARAAPQGIEGRLGLANAWKSVIKKSRAEESADTAMSKAQRVALGLIRLNKPEA
ncbi:MAG: hypothetical protein A3G34_07475 [Candidatus Lindowbacteria bacterium RIFCSPLOWO2_12_FULL_62_27]|nr:MAG: hypothetical protein A3G34_07475 [Candidatus Lindowbacteria bacterium RIFCSPLOWO2_12_FULL_62_27]OGH62274.1 MAG: hypothetical protein A3I06_04965 [Candidatus Lindowbacteria bacterium RIFCSPLOWO2_02_FULL_62_12]